MLKRFAKTKTIICVTAASTVVIVLAILAISFRIGSIEVRGASEISAEHIIDLSGLKVGQNIALMYIKNPLMMLLPEKCDAAEKIISGSPLVEDAFIQTEGRRAVITITECEPAFYLNIGPVLLLVDKDGRILEAVEKSEGEFLTFKGINIDTYFVGGSIPKEFSDTIALMKNVSEAVRSADEEAGGQARFMDRIDYIEIGTDGNILFFCKDYIVMNIGADKDIKTKITYARKILLDELADGQTGYVDFTTGPNPVFMPDK